jgi:hypothetical protein
VMIQVQEQRLDTGRVVSGVLAQRSKDEDV